MNDERFKEEMIRMMGTVINKIDGLDKRLSNVEGDVSTLKSDVVSLISDVSTLKSDISEIKSVQKEHTKILHRLDAKTDTIAEKVLNHEIRITKAEQNIENLQGGVH